MISFLDNGNYILFIRKENVGLLIGGKVLDRKQNGSGFGLPCAAELALIRNAEFGIAYLLALTTRATGRCIHSIPVSEFKST